MAWTKEQWRHWSRQYYIRNREKILAKKASERAENPTLANEKSKAWRLANHAAALAIDKRHRERYKEKGECPLTTGNARFC